MTIEKKITENEAELKLTGWLDTQSTPMLEEALDGLGSDITDLTLDFADLEYVSSAGLRQIVAAYKKMNGALTLKNVSEEIMLAVDKGDSADFTREEILNPTDWVLMNFLMDARTGLGRFHDFRISNYALMMELIDYCVNHSIKDVLELPDVKERVELYFEQQELFKQQLKELTKIVGKVAVIYLRNTETIYAGNRFMVYAMWPETELSVHVAWGFKKQNTAVMIGKSIINRASKFNIGELCLSYGGGGHANAGTCQLDNDKIDAELPIILDKLNGLREV